MNTANQAGASSKATDASNSAGSSPARNAPSTPSVSIEERFTQLLSENEGDGEPQEHEEPSDEGEDERGSEAADDGDEQPEEKQKPDKKSKKDKNTKDATVPLSVLHARIGKKNEQIQGLSEQLQAKDLDISKRDAAIQILSQRLQDLESRLGQHVQLDPRDAELESYRLRESAREASERIQREHQERWQRQQQESLIAEQTSVLQQEIDAACESFPLASDVEVARLMSKNPKMSAEQAARTLHEKRRKALGVEGPRAPTTPRAVANGSRYQFEDSAKGIEQRLRSLLGD